MARALLLAVFGLGLVAVAPRESTATAPLPDRPDPEAIVASSDPVSGQDVASEPVPLSTRARAGLGLVLLVGLTWLMSAHRAAIPWRVLLWGLGLQLVFALLILRTPVGEGFFQGVDSAMHAVLDRADDGGRFIFGNLIENNIPVGDGIAGTNDPLPSVSGRVARSGAFFAFNVLPTIIFVSSLMTVLYHIGIMQWAVRGVAWVMQRTMGTSGAETVAAAGNIFVGLMEAPLFVKPYIAGMTRSELMAVMAAGFATVSGGTLAAYVGMLSPYYPGIAGHLIAASVMSAPAALVVAKILLPETEEPMTAGTLAMSVERPDVNLIDAAARGAGEGLRLALNVGGMLIAFLALLALADALVGMVGAWFGASGITLSSLLGAVLRPVAWMIGIPWAESSAVGQLVGVKTVLNEFVAFLQLADLSQETGALSPRSVTITTYALAGFANFGSVAMTIAGLGEIAPSRRPDLARLGIKAMIGGTIAALMTAAWAGLLV